jgi:hypothetical protein
VLPKTVRQIVDGRCDRSKYRLAQEESRIRGALWRNADSCDDPISGVLRAYISDLHDRHTAQCDPELHAPGTGKAWIPRSYRLALHYLPRRCTTLNRHDKLHSMQSPREKLLALDLPDDDQRRCADLPDS